MPLRLAFMGSATFSLPSLDALLHAGHEVVAVYTQPPRPAGRGHRLKASPVHTFAEDRGLAVLTPKTLRDADAQHRFAALGLDAAVVAAYGLILPQPILDAPRLGCINVHGSLLPRWRGAAPVERALLTGDTETGVTIMQMDAGLDTGPMLRRERVAITGSTTAATLRETLAVIGARLLVEVLEGLAAGTERAIPQPADGVTYAKKLERDEGRIDWSRPATEIERAVRALNPDPGVWFERAGERIKVLAAEVVDATGPPGTVLDDRLAVGCGAGALRLQLLQRAGRAPLAADTLLRGYPLPPGTRLG